MVALELLAFRIPALRAYFAAVLKVGVFWLTEFQFAYDADLVSEDVLLKWSEEPLKHRFSCLTDKFIKELHEVAEPMIDWLLCVCGEGVRCRNAEPSEEEMEMDMNDLEEGAAEEEEEGEGDDDDDDDDDDDEE